MAANPITEIRDIPKLSDKELERYLEAGEFHQVGHQFALQEYNRRKLAAISKPHWTLTPTFIVALAALLVAGLAAYFSYLSIPQRAQSSGGDRQAPVESKWKNTDEQ
jgi:hypothetical protein